MAFVEGVLVGGTDTDTDRNVLLFGRPRSKAGERVSNVGVMSVSEVKTDSLVGIHRGLVWEIELDKPDDQGKHRESDQGDKEKWLVCMEWDLLQ